MKQKFPDFSPKMYEVLESLASDDPDYELVYRLTTEMIDDQKSEQELRAMAYAHRALVFYDQNKPQEALDDLSRAIELTEKPRAELFYRRSLAYQEFKEYEKALADCEQALKIEPDAEKFLQRGIIHYNLGEKTAAFHDFTCSLDMQPSPEAFGWRSHIYQERNDLEKSLADCNEALRLEKNITGFRNRGVVYLDLKQFDAAINDFNEALKLDPNNVNVLQWRASAKWNKRDSQGTLEDSLRATALNPRAAYAWRLSGEAYLAEEEYVKSEECLSKAISLEPDNADLYWIRSLVYDGLKDTDKSRSDWKKAAERNQQYKEKLEKYDEHDRALNDPDMQAERAIELLTERIEKEQENSSLYFWRARRFLQSGNRVRAIEDMDAAVRFSENSITMRYWRILTYFVSFDNEPDFRKNDNAVKTIIDDCTACIDVKERFDDEERVGLQMLRVFAYWFQNEHRKALGDLNEIKKVSPYNLPVINLCSVLCRLKLADPQQYETALDECHAVIKDDPNCAEAFFCRAKVFEKMGEFSKATDDFEAAKRLGFNEDEDSFFVPTITFSDP